MPTNCNETKVGQALSPVRLWGRRSRLPIPGSRVPEILLPDQTLQHDGTNFRPALKNPPIRNSVSGSAFCMRTRIQAQNAHP